METGLILALGLGAVALAATAGSKSPAKVVSAPPRPAVTISQNVAPGAVTTGTDPVELTLQQQEALCQKPVQEGRFFKFHGIQDDKCQWKDITSEVWGTKVGDVTQGDAGAQQQLFISSLVQPQ